MLDFTRLMLTSTQVLVLVEVGVELGNIQDITEKCFDKAQKIAEGEALIKQF